MRKTKADRDQLRETMEILRKFPKGSELGALLDAVIGVLIEDCDELEELLGEHKKIIDYLTEQMKNNKEASEAVKLQQAEMISHLTNQLNSVNKPCCSNYDTCEEACVHRVNHFKEKAKQQAEMISHLTNTCTVSAEVINNFLDEYRKEVLLKAAKEFEIYNPLAEIARISVADILTDMAYKKYDE